MFTSIRFRLDLILVGYFSTIVTKFPSWEDGLWTSAENDTPEAHMVIIYLPKVAVMETQDFLRILVAQNKAFHTLLWPVFSSKVEGSRKLLMIGAGANN